MRQKDGVDDANVSPLLSGREQPQTEPTALTHDFSGIRGIYLDLDDTLCGYWDASKAGLRKAFDICGPSGFTPEECVRAWAAAFREFAPTLKKTGWYEGYLKVGEPTRTEQMRLTLRRLQIEDESMAQALSEMYMRERDASLTLFDDALEVLEALKSRYPLGLITNGPADIQRMEIKTLGIEKYFDHILIEGEMGEGKPKPSVFALAANLMELAPQDLLMVGNSYQHDVLAAMENGWSAIWIRRPTDIPPSAGPEAVLPETLPPGAPAPHAVVNNLTDVLRLLG